MREHLTLRKHPLDQRLHRTAARFDAQQPRLDHACVVEDEQVAGRKQLGQVAKAAIDCKLLAPVEQTRRAALFNRVLRNEFWGQNEVEIAQRVGRKHRSRAGPARTSR